MPHTDNSRRIDRNKQINKTAQRPEGIRQGEDLKFIFDLDGDDITGWIALIEVKVFPGDVALISRIVPATGNAWVGFLTSTETAALAVSSDSPYYLTAILRNASLNQERQIPTRFHVTPSWILPPVPSFLLLEDGLSKVVLEDGLGAILLE